MMLLNARAVAVLFSGVLCFLPLAVQAQAIPGTASADRVQISPPTLGDSIPQRPQRARTGDVDFSAPEGAESIV